jgi:hypothetical protein
MISLAGAVRSCDTRPEAALILSDAPDVISCIYNRGNTLIRSPRTGRLQSAYDLCLCVSWLVAQGFSFEASCAASLLQMDRCEIAFVQIGNSDWRRPCARWRPPTFRNVYSPKTPQSPHVNKFIGAKLLESWRSLGTRTPVFAVRGRF